MLRFENLPDHLFLTPLMLIKIRLLLILFCSSSSRNLLQVTPAAPSAAQLTPEAPNVALSTPVATSAVLFRSSLSNGFSLTTIALLGMVVDVPSANRSLGFMTMDDADG